MFVYQLVVTQRMFVVLFVELFSNSFSAFIFSADLMTQALFYSQGMRAFPFATFTIYHHLDPPPSFYCTIVTDKHYWLSFLFQCTTNISGTMLIWGNSNTEQTNLQEKGR